MAMLIGAGYGMLQCPLILNAWKSFKMNEDMFGFDLGGEGAHHKRYDVTMPFLERMQKTPVCPLGKFGAVVIIVWTIVATMVLVTNPYKRKGLVAVLNFLFFAVVLGASLAMNPELAARSSSFLAAEFGVSLLLLHIKR